MKELDNIVLLSKDLEEKYKDDPAALQEIKHILRSKARRDSEICVIYNPDCGCSVESLYALDRFPMSELILGSCPECKKHCLWEISDPITFHCKLRKEDFSLEDLKDMVIMDSHQKEYLFAYQQLSLK